MFTQTNTQANNTDTWTDTNTDTEPGDIERAAMHMRSCVRLLYAEYSVCMPGPRDQRSSDAALTRPTFLYISDVFDFYEPILIWCRNYFHARLIFNTAAFVLGFCMQMANAKVSTHTHTQTDIRIEFKYGNAGCAISFRFVMPVHWLPAYFWLTALPVGNAAMQNRQLLW